MRADKRRGYTLIELVVTVLIIGILTSIAVPQYLKTVEVGKADDAVSTVNMIATTNKMYALDHAGFYVAGAFPTTTNTACGTTVTCGAGACAPGAVATNACCLVACKYLADQDWGDRPYTFNACDAAGGGGGGGCAATDTAYAARAATANAPYSGWNYVVGATGLITAGGGAPAPTF